MLSSITMESSTIAFIIRYFNIMSTIGVGILAVCGLVVVVGRNARFNFLRNNMWVSAFCVAALAAFIMEIAFFNYKHYLKYFAGKEFSITSSLKGIEIDDNSVGAEFGGEKKDDKVFLTTVLFKNVNRKVTSVFIQPAFNNREMLRVQMRWSDESHVLDVVHNFVRTLYKALPHENHIAIQPNGNVSELEISWEEPLLSEEISKIVINGQIPFYFSGLRLLVVSLLFFAVILFVYKPLRIKTAYYLFEYKFDPANKRQNLVFAGFVMFTIAFSWFFVYTTKPYNSYDCFPNVSYNKYLVDAFIAGKTNVDVGEPEKLLNVERPHDGKILSSMGFVAGKEFDHDISYYKGKFYLYYGVVPVVFCYLPYKLITGKYMSHHAGVFIFASIAAVFLALLWRFLVKRYMPNARFAFVLLSFLALFLVSFIFDGLRLPSYGSVPQVAGVAIYVAGTFLLLKSVDKERINRWQLFIACFCFALTVGCRPDMMLLSILVPVVLWKRRSWRLAMFVLIPYIMVAIPFMYYNYVRFESIFEFGFKYCIGGTHETTAVHLLNPLGKIHRTIVVFIYYLFRLYDYSLSFPYVDTLGGRGLSYAEGFTMYKNGGGGLINYPILFCLFYLFKNVFSKNKPTGFYLSLAFFVISAIMILAFSTIGTYHERYMMDFSVFLGLSALFCAYYYCDGPSKPIRYRQKIVYVLLAVSISVGTLRVISGSDHKYVSPMDPVLYRYLETSLGLVERS